MGIVAGAALVVVVVVGQERAKVEKLFIASLGEIKAHLYVHIKRYAPSYPDTRPPSGRCIISLTLVVGDDGRERIRGSK